MSFPYDPNFVYPTKEAAEAAVVAQDNRINLVVAWLKAHGAPSRATIAVICSTWPSETGPPQWCIPYLSYEGKDDDGAQASIQMTLYLVLRQPTVALVELARRFGSDAAAPETGRRRLFSKQITLERWIEPEPFTPLPPVARPFGPHWDQFDEACMLSNSSDQFKLGAQWTEPDETLWQKESARRMFVTYYRWRQISAVVARNAPE